MSRYEKRLAAMREAQDAVGRAEPRREPLMRSEIEAFLRGFALSTSARRQIVEKWDTDATNQHRAGYNEGMEAQ